MLPKAVRIRQVTTENSRTKTLVLDEEIEAQPGQFVMVWLPRRDEKPISLAAASPLSLMIAAVGPATRALCALEPGDRLYYRGPYGKGYRLEGKGVLMVGGGYGVAPLAFLAKDAIERGIEVTMVIGARHKDELLYEDRFRELGAQVILTTDDGSRGRQGLATDAAQEVLQEDHIDAVYSCGPELMMAALGPLAEQRGIPCYLSVERYMKCGGLSLCGACELNGVLLCAEGPVLEYRFLKTLPDFGVAHRDATATKHPW